MDACSGNKYEAGAAPVTPTIGEFLILRLYLYGEDFGF